MPMKNPPHPRGFVFRQCIEPLGLSITDAAAALGVTRTMLSELVNGKRGISPELPVRQNAAHRLRNQLHKGARDWQPPAARTVPTADRPRAPARSPPCSGRAARYAALATLCCAAAYTAPRTAHSPQPCCRVAIRKSGA